MFANDMWSSSVSWSLKLCVWRKPTRMSYIVKNSSATVVSLYLSSTNLLRKWLNVHEEIVCLWLCMCNQWGLLYVTFSKVVCGLHDSKLIKEVVRRQREKVSPFRIHCPLTDSQDKRAGVQRGTRAQTRVSVCQPAQTDGHNPYLLASLIQPC